MSFNNFSSSVKLNNIKAYNSVNTNTNDAFKKQVYSDIEEIDYGSYEEIDYNSIDLQEGIENAIEKRNEKEWYEVVGATACVTVNSITSGILKLSEYADDGLTWLGGMAVSGVARLFGQKEFAENIEEMTMDEIARDKVGELNEFFYENTELGKAINDASALKYDSELAKGIQNVTTEVVVIAAATAATVVTGGAAAPLFAAGFAIGAGQSAEKNYQDKENRDFWKDSAEIAVDGTIKGLSTVAYGKAGATAVNGVKTLGKLGLKGIKGIGKQAFSSISKESLKQTAKQSGKIALKTAGQTLVDKDTWQETGTVLLDDVKTGMQTGQWNVLKMVGDAALIYGENYIGNLAGNVVGDVLSGVKNSPNTRLEASMMDRIKNKSFFKTQGKYSDDAAFELYKRSIDDAIATAKQNGDKDVQNMLEKLYLLNDKRPGWTIYFDPNNGAFSEAYGSGSLHFGENVISGNQKGVVYHELGHTLHGAINDSAVPKNYMDVKLNVEKHMSQNTGFVAECMDYLQNVQNHSYLRATEYFDQNMASSVVEQLNNADWNEVMDNYIKAGFSEQQAYDFVQTDFNTQYQNIRNSEIYKLADNYQHEQGVDAVSDIIASEFNGNRRFAVLDSNGNKVYLGGDTTYAHDKEYYTKHKDIYGNIIGDKTLQETNECAFHEQIANYIELKLSNDTAHLNMLNSLLGEDWTQMMELEFNKILNYFK